MLRTLLLAFGLLLVSFPSDAQYVYVWRDADGVVNYSDLPPVGGEVGHVRRLRVDTFTTAEGGGSVPSSSAQSPSQSRQAKSIASVRARDRGLSEDGGDTYSGGISGGAGLAAGGSGRGGASSVGGSGGEGGGSPLAAGNSAPSASTTTASSAQTPAVAVPISTAPAPDLAVPISTAPAPDLAVPISTAPAPDLAVPISTTPATGTSSVTTSAATTPSGVSTTSGGSSGSSTGGQIAGGAGGTAQATLYWDQPKGANIEKSPVAGYRVYFGPGPGSYLQPFGQGVSVGKVTSYTVQGLTSGTYYFAVTTYVGGHESRYSSEVFKTIP